MKTITNLGQDPGFLLFNVKRMENNTVKLGIHVKNKDLEVGDKLMPSHCMGITVLVNKNPMPAKYFVVDEILEIRDCKGVYKIPEPRIKSHYTVLAHPEL